MPTNNRHYFVAILLPETQSRELVKLRDKHGLPAWIGSAGPHITLVPPFDTDIPLDSLSDYLKNATHRSPFEIILDGMGRFDNEKSILFAKVKPSPELTALAKETLVSLQHLGAKRNEGFIPHVSLAAVSPRRDVDEFERKLSSEKINYRFRCEQFHLLRKEENPKQWKPVREFTLIG